jgi:hypothetical protein
MVDVPIDIHENLPLMSPQVPGDVFWFDAVPVGGLDFQNDDEIIPVF